jgi:hypothetical protein
MSSTHVSLRLFVAGAMALALAGCAEPQWHKPNTESARLEEDLGQCRMEARLQASRESFPRPLYSPAAVGTDSTAQGSSAELARTDPLLLEQDLTSSCMRGKGYDLAPIVNR